MFPRNRLPAFGDRPSDTEGRGIRKHLVIRQPARLEHLPVAEALVSEATLTLVVEVDRTLFSQESLDLDAWDAWAGAAKPWKDMAGAMMRG